MKMSFGNRIGFRDDGAMTFDALFSPVYGAIVAECEGEVPGGVLLGHTQEKFALTFPEDEVDLASLQSDWETVLEEIYPTRVPQAGELSAFTCEKRPAYVAKHAVARPHVVIPAFPGTNSEYDSAAACCKAGLEPEIFVVRNLTPQWLQESVEGLSAAIARSQAGRGRRAFILGGETVVHLPGDGLGGRNQELALSAARGMDGLTGALLFSVGSDGTDGPTDAAGGWVDGNTAAALREKGIDIEQVLARNDAYRALQACGGLITTGPTGTNVNDLTVLLVE